MSFETLKEEELRAAAAMLAVDLDESVAPKGKFSAKLAAAAFAEEGVTWDIYQAEKARLQAIEDEAKALAEEEERLAAQRLANTITTQVDPNEDEVEPVEDEVIVTRRRRPRSTDVLVKMNRQNPHYEVNGKVFTKEHPFVLMSEADAQKIFDSETGFHIATPREAAEYYS